MIITVDHIQCILIIGFVLGIVMIVVGYMDMRKRRKEIMEGFSDSPHYPEAHNSLLLDSIFERKGPEILSYEDQANKVPKSHVQSFKQYTTYNNNNNKFDLRKYENSIKENMTESINEDIVQYLQNLN